ncbi:MAG: glycerol-3-phosphate 1-O-acyltransferase PlsY [Rickettsiales bacterium]|jgi:glycerol-3-phosphate acyltransferase PlsY|nr:glycerol-3-phosphate 1-O-acyltransferase PlsY [Rickettsiales bacterium]
MTGSLNSFPIYAVVLYLIPILGGYLLGSVPFGLILTKIAGLGDIRKIGSGNIGATNVLRAGGIKLAVSVFLLDAAKAAVAFFLFGVWGGLAAIIGHNYPVWLKFKGGKGVSSSGGFLLVLSPIAFATCFAIWLVVALAFGYSSLGAIVAMLFAPILGFAIGFEEGLALLAVSLLGLWRHRGNIQRLLAGAESKIKWRRQ